MEGDGEMARASVYRTVLPGTVRQRIDARNAMLHIHTYRQSQLHSSRQKP